MRSEAQEGKYKILVIAILLAGACFAIYYFHVVLQSGRVFTHFFYIPIILASLWWKRKGLVVAIFLAILLIFSHFFFRLGEEPVSEKTVNDLLRASMFIFVALMTATLAENIAKERKKLTHLNAVLRAIRNVNQLVVIEKDRDRLIQGACDRLIETRGYYNAWIALVDENRGCLCAAEAGLGEGFSSVVEMMKRGEFTRCARNALKQSGIVVVEDVGTACAGCPLVGTYAGRAAMTIRLEHDSRIYGILCVSIPAEMATDADERSLFGELSDDIALGLHSIEQEEERKRTEAKMEEERTYAANIVATVPESLVVVDRDLRVKKANLTFYETFQTGPEKAIGSNICDILQDKDGKLASELTGVFGTEAMLEKFELRYTSEKLGELIFDITARGMIREEELVVIRDRTVRKRAEEDLEKAKKTISKMNEELERKIEEKTSELSQTQAQLFQTSKLATLGEMAAGLAHEMNQPLGGISLVTKYFRNLMERGKLSQEEIGSGLKDVEVSVKRMSKTIRHIRVFARQDTLKFVQVDVNETIRSALGLLGEQLRLHDIEVVQDLSSALPRIIGEPYQLEQVWINFIGNARDAVDEKEKQIADGRLQIRDYRKRINISTAYNGESELVEVNFGDNGIGMSKEARERVFEPFFTTKEVGSALGLGLSISHGIIEGHKGKIEVESKEGEGTTVRATLLVGGS